MANKPKSKGKNKGKGTPNNKGRGGKPNPKLIQKLKTITNKQLKAGKDARQRAKKDAGKIRDAGKDYLGFAQEQFQVSQDRQAELDAVSQQFADQQMQISQEDRARYEQIFQPLENRIVTEAETWDSPEQQAQAAAAAAADVQSAAARERAAGERRAFGLGINPASGAYAGIDRAAELGTALGTVDAMNNARTGVEEQGYARRMNAVGLGQRLPGQAQAAGAAGVGAVGNANQAWMSTPGIAGAGYTANLGATANAGDLNQAGYRTELAGYAGGAGTTGGVYNTQADIYRQQLAADAASEAANAAGIGEVAGQVAGTALPLILSSDRDKKRDIKPVKEGAALAAVEKMPVDSWRYKPGLGEPPGRHVGPMAQDFKKTTGKGDGKSIPTVDAIGTTMRAVQDLSKKVDRIAKAVGIGGGKRRSTTPQRRAA